MCFFSIQWQTTFVVSPFPIIIISLFVVNVNEKIKVHSLQETIEKYTEFSEVGGSKQFVQELIDRVESLENKKLDRNCLEKYKKIDFSDKKEMLKTLAKKLISGEKISQDYKNFWRENINSDVSENRIVAEGYRYSRL